MEQKLNTIRSAEIQGAIGKHLLMSDKSQAFAARLPTATAPSAAVSPSSGPVSSSSSGPGPEPSSDPGSSLGSGPGPDFTQDTALPAERRAFSGPGS